MTRTTSAEAYRHIQESGILGRRQKEVYDILYHSGPLTYNQVYEVLKEKYGGRWTGINSSRLTELRDMGAIKEVGTAQDEFSKMKVILWDVTDQQPVKPPAKETKEQIITALRKENADLKNRLSAMTKEYIDYRARHGLKADRESAMQARLF